MPQEERLIFLMRVSKWWKEQALEQNVSNLAWFLQSSYWLLNLADPTAALRWEILDGDDIEGDGIEEGIPYLCIWEITGTLDESGKPIPTEENGNEAPSDGEEPGSDTPKRDMTGVPTITDDEISPDLEGENGD